jgi:hypothetical protein
VNVSARADKVSAAPKPNVLPEPALKAAASWVTQFARTLKTCRLYDPANPAVLRFRDELRQATLALVSDHGSITLRFSSDDVTCDEHSLYPARSRDDNLAYPFHRDGVRSITLNPEIEAEEVDMLVNSVLAATGSNLDDGDLVTLLWEADLRHVDVDFIPSEGDVGPSPSSAQLEADGPMMPWPEPPDEDPAAPKQQPDPVPLDAVGRSEDWSLGDLTVEVEASYVELDSLAPAETERFRREFAEEHQVAPETAALAIATACLRAGAKAEDEAEIATFMPRVLRGALAAGAWTEGHEALRTLRELPPSKWSEETFVQELLQPVSVVRVVERLDQQEPDALGAFLALAREVGDAGVDWMTLALGESQRRATRQVLAEALAETCRDNPERLAPWLSDARWYVVRNIVYILGWIGGPGIVGMLQVALRHPDARVRSQVVAALSQIELRHARPLLVRALDGADTRLFCQVLSQLSGARDPATARFVLAFLQQERFVARPGEERRAIYAALASVGSDEVVPELEAELQRSNWFDKALEIHRHNVARCLARIGTASARAVLERGAQSRRAPVRHAAITALATLREAA